MSSFTSLHDIYDKGCWNLEDIKKFLETDSSSVNKVNSHEDTPLTRVLDSPNKCSVDHVKLLLNYGADVNYNNRSCWKSPLANALKTNRNVDYIKLLLEKGANVNARGPLGISLICFALQYSSIDVIRLLLDAGCLQYECAWHGTILHCAIERISVHPVEYSVLQLLLEKRADINAVNQSDQSLMCYALDCGVRASTINVLLAAGFVFECTHHSNLFICATRSMATKLEADVVQMLVERGAGVDIEILKYAVQKRLNETKPIELLLEQLQGLDIKTVEDEMNNNLLHLAVENPLVNQSLVKFLVKRGIGINTVNKNGDTPLHKLATHSNLLSNIVKTLLKMGSQVNLENSSGETPLHLAMKQNQKADIYKMFLVAGARIGTSGYSLLKAAIDSNSEDERELDCCKMLVKGYFLENSNFDFQSLIQGHNEYEELSRFGVDCVRELQKMDLQVNSQGCTLREFLNQRSPFQVEEGNCEIETESVFFHWLMKIIAENAFPLFFDIISGKFGRSSMKTKLQKLQVYTYLCNESHMGEKVFLNYDVVQKISFLLTDDEDLLSFISAFYRIDDYSCDEKFSEENIYENKRSSEHSQQYHKCPRLHH